MFGSIVVSLARKLVQRPLEEAFSTIRAGCRVMVTDAGYTDSGVYTNPTKGNFTRLAYSGWSIMYNHPPSSALFSAPCSLHCYCLLLSSPPPRHTPHARDNTQPCIHHNAAQRPHIAVHVSRTATLQGCREAVFAAVCRDVRRWRTCSRSIGRAESEGVVLHPRRHASHQLDVRIQRPCRRVGRTCMDETGATVRVEWLRGTVRAEWLRSPRCRLAWDSVQRDVTACFGVTVCQVKSVVRRRRCMGAGWR